MLVELPIKHITLEDITFFGYQYNLIGEKRFGRQRATLWLGPKRIEVVVKFYRNGMGHVHKVLGPYPDDGIWLRDIINKNLFDDVNSEYFVHKSMAHDMSFLVGAIQTVIIFFTLVHFWKDFPLITVLDGLTHLICITIVCILGTFHDKIHSKTWEEYLRETEEENRLFPPNE